MANRALVRSRNLAIILGVSFLISLNPEPSKAQSDVRIIQKKTIQIERKPSIRDHFDYCLKNRKNCTSTNTDQDPLLIAPEVDSKPVATIDIPPGLIHRSSRATDPFEEMASLLLNLENELLDGYIVWSEINDIIENLDVPYVISDLESYEDNVTKIISSLCNAEVFGKKIPESTAISVSMFIDKSGASITSGHPVMLMMNRLVSTGLYSGECLENFKAL